MNVHSVTVPTTSYDHSYDGFADFPTYPINLVSDINAHHGPEATQAAGLVEFQHAHTQTGSRIDTHA